ncbi:MAG: hypothetical protein EOO40_09260, partial [Deltaproteobacteria bacterium]
MMRASTLTHAALCAALLSWRPAQAASGEPADVQFATLVYSGGNDNPRPRGLPRLAWELRP